MFAVVFAILGLTPSLSWIPEVPLLVAGGLVPVATLAFTGYRAGKNATGVMSGAIAGAAAGAIAGCVGGLAYVAYGKSVVNVVAGTVLGVIAGGMLGAAGSITAHRYARGHP